MKVIVLPKSVTKGKVIKQTNADGTHRYDSSLRINGDIKQPLKDFLRNLIQNTGTMQNSSLEYCVIVCQ